MTTETEELGLGGDGAIRLECRLEDGGMMGGDAGDRLKAEISRQVRAAEWALDEPLPDEDSAFQGVEASGCPGRGMHDE